jgi:GNAT superfamily N-acetyltransferase
MAFAVAISEVGPAEFPLIQVLRDTVFREFNHHSRAPIAQGLSDRTDLLLLMAHLEGNPVGFSAGYRRMPHAYYINYMAILPDYRGQGLGTQLMSRQESFARARGYQSIQFNTFNRFPAMMRLGMSMGYQPIGLEQHDETGGELAIRFGKSLVGENRPVDPRFYSALQRGDEILGLARDPSSGALRPILRSEAADDAD